MIALRRIHLHANPRALLAAAVVGVALTGLAVAALLGGDASSTAEPDVSPTGFAVGHSADRWPSETLESWTSFADQVSVVSIIDDRRVPAAELVADGGYENRVITLQIDETVWTRPDAPTIQGTVKMLDWGYLTSDGVRVRFIVADGVWPEVGKRYLAPLVRSDEGTWTFLSSGAISELEAGEASGAVDAGEPSEALLAVKGHSAQEVGAMLSTTEPDPVAAKHAELPPDERFDAVAAQGP